MSRAARSALASMARACSSSISPAAVGTTPRRWRSSSGACTCSSSSAMRLLMADEPMCCCSPARAILPRSQAATKSRRVVRSRSFMAVMDFYLGNSEAKNYRFCTLVGMSKVPFKTNHPTRTFPCQNPSVPCSPPSSARSACAMACKASRPCCPPSARRNRYAMPTLPGLFVSVLVPNLRGAEGALASGADLMLVPLSASHAHSLANLRKTPDEVVAEVARMRAARDAAGSKMLIEGGIGTAFGCTLQGRVEPAEVLRCMQALLDAGADRVSMADTVGHGGPGQVQSLFEQARRIAGERFWCGHFHDTRGLALANVH